MAFAARLALICTLVAVFAEVYKTPEIALTVYVVFFLNKPDRASSMLLTVAIVVIITVVVGITFLTRSTALGKSWVAGLNDGLDFVRDDVSIIGEQAQAGRDPS